MHDENVAERLQPPDNGGSYSQLLTSRMLVNVL